MKKYIFNAILVAGSLDILFAFAQGYIVKRTTPEIVLRYIASGLFGNKAFSGGALYPVLGLLIHFLIVFCCIVVYFKLYPKLSFLRKSILLSSFLVALVAWFVTTCIVIPISKIPAAPFNLTNSLIAIAILFFAIGIPTALYAKACYKR